MRVALLLYFAFIIILLSAVSKVKFVGVEKEVVNLCKNIIDTAEETGVAYRLVCNVGDGFVEFGGERAEVRTTYAAVSSYGWGTP